MSDPLDKQPDLNYDYYIKQEQWEKTIHVVNSPLLLLVNRLVNWLPAEVHRNAIKTVMEKYKYHKEMSRSNHYQIAAIIGRSMESIKSQADKLDDFEIFEKELTEALLVALAIEKECARRAEERKKKETLGNIVWKTIPIKAAK